MRPFLQPYSPIERARIGLGQFSPFINPFEVTGESPTPAVPPTSALPSVQDAAAIAKAAGGIVKTTVVLTGLGLTLLSAATAYVGISFGLDKKQTNVERALGWTVGVVGALSGVTRLGTTLGALFISAPDLPAPSNRVLAGRKG